MAAEVVELASLFFTLYTPNHKSVEDESGFIHVSNTPTATARQYFRPTIMDSNIVHLVYVPLLLIGCKFMLSYILKQIYL